MILALPECWCVECLQKRFPGLPVTAGFEDDTKHDGERTLAHFRNAAICQRDTNLGGDSIRYYGDFI